MPFVSQFRPSLQLGLLKAIGATDGFDIETFHLNLDFAKQIGPQLYETICDYGRTFTGDWLFSKAAYGDDAPDLDGAFLHHLEESEPAFLAAIGQPLESLRTLRDEAVPLYLQELLGTVPWHRFRVVGFTSTFEQNAASIALARRLKERFPRLLTLFGGANLDGEMGTELVRATPSIDLAVVGEGDRAFPQLLTALEAGLDPTSVPGVISRKGKHVSGPLPQPLLQDLDSLPNPDYGEYFARATALGLLANGPSPDVWIPFESARGCWWGQKRHCTFCGLNGSNMAYRSKSPRRVAAELEDAVQRYQTWRFEAVDNILDMSYLDSLFPQLIREGPGYQFFYELKANLTRRQLELLSHAGVRDIQAGIESLSSHVLKLMRKGVTAIQNVNTLRWAKYYDVGVSWNLLWGAYGECLDDYAGQNALIPLIIHLQPPTGLSRLWMERFSPMYFDRDSFRAEFVRPHPSYRYIYPSSVDLESVAYFFDYQFVGSLSEEDLRPTRDLVRAWRSAWKSESRPQLTYRSAPGFLQIEDQRDERNVGTYTFRDALARMYVASSDRPRSATSLKRTLDLPWSEQEITEALDGFCAAGLMMREGPVFLSLAIPARIEKPPR